MKGLLIIAMSVLLSSCSSPESGVREVKVASLNPATERIVLITLANGAAIHWDNQVSRIVTDSLYQRIVARFPENQQRFMTLISDTTSTAARACSTSRDLVVGDIAFLLLDKVKNVPLIRVFHTQWDVMQKDCPYPYYMLDYIKDNRQKVRSQLEAYYSSVK